LFEGSRDCAWVAEDPETRCGHRGEVTAKEVCRKACGFPGGVDRPTFEVESEAPTYNYLCVIYSSPQRLAAMACLWEKLASSHASTVGHGKSTLEPSGTAAVKVPARSTAACWI